MPKITYKIGDQIYVVEGNEGDTLLQIALDQRVPMEHACGGNGFCTTCMCNVTEGIDNLNERNDREENMGVTDDPYRLGCQAQVKGDVSVELEE